MNNIPKYKAYIKPFKQIADVLVIDYITEEIYAEVTLLSGLKDKRFFKFDDIELMHYTYEKGMKGDELYSGYQGMYILTTHWVEKERIWTIERYGHKYRLVSNDDLEVDDENISWEYFETIGTIYDKGEA